MSPWSPGFSSRPGSANRTVWRAMILPGNGHSDLHKRPMRDSVTGVTRGNDTACGMRGNERIGVIGAAIAKATCYPRKMADRALAPAAEARALFLGFNKQFTVAIM